MLAVEVYGVGGWHLRNTGENAGQLIKQMARVDDIMLLLPSPDAG